ncbi:Uncharacterised protein [Mycobacteroides abscessus subsp. abscessus]|nr:Uncharacterised protein [Mycobacteroides abscessus subsp. abscessus]
MAGLRSGGAIITTDCEKSRNRAGSPAVSSNHAATGLSGTSPEPPPSGSGRRGTLARSSLPARAIARIVLCSKMSRGDRAKPASRAADASRIDMIESPPSAKNESVTLTRSIPSIPATTAAN